MSTDTAERHRELMVIDGTCPLASVTRYIDWYIEGGVDVISPTVGAWQRSPEALERIGALLGLIRRRDDLTLVTTGDEARRAKQAGQAGLVFHLQGTNPLDENLRFVEVYKRLGVGIIQLTYNTENAVGFGAQVDVDDGLKPFGRSVVAACNDAKVIVDVSHTGHRTSMEAIAASAAPVILSHANPAAVFATESERNVSDELISAIADNGGIMGITGYPGFLGGGTRPSIECFIEHIDHVVQVGGIDCVALGIDYYQGQHPVMDDEAALANYQQLVADGTWQGNDYPPPPYYYPAGIETPRTLPNLTAKLIERGYSDTDLAKIMGGNWLRMYDTIWG